MKDQYVIFFSETALNAKYQIKTDIEISGGGVTHISSNSIHTHKNKIFKNLNNYWVTKSVLEALKKDINSESTSF